MVKNCHLSLKGKIMTSKFEGIFFPKVDCRILLISTEVKLFLPECFLMETPKPILSQLLRDENEVQNIFEFFKYKIEERENKNKYGGIMSKGMCTTLVANRARLALPRDVVQYIEKSLTKKEMEKNRVGRKKNRFQKRSETVKSNQAVTYLPDLFEKDSNNISPAARTTKLDGPHSEHKS